MQTLFENNYHGISGAGDCDCFVITATACFIVSGLPCQIVLAGNKPDSYTHIYNRVKDFQEWINFDLTNPHFDTERAYKYKKIFDVEVI